jgi:uncharacterized damage-inducible protein DinB
MPVSLALDDLLDYTDWEREKWLQWMRQRDEGVLEISAGPHGDGRFESTGELVRHIFSAEKRYVERLSGRPITDPATIPADNVEGLFQFGRQSRLELREFISAFPPGDWDTPREFNILNNLLTATPGKIVVHILLHEIRHWAQISTVLRMHGLKDDFHDFLFSPVRAHIIKHAEND